jgi:hypothetical protein
MRKLLREIFIGKSTFSNGILALAIIGLIALGCTCNGKKFDFGTKSDTDSSKEKTKEEGNPFETPDVGDFEKADASKGEIPSNAELQTIIKEDMLRFDKALKDKDFEDFYNNASKIWQENTSPRKLKKEFQNFIDGKADLSSVKNLEADFSPSPKIDDSKKVDVLEVKGTYDTPPNKSSFDLKYIPEGKEWKLIGFYVKTTVYKKR